MTLEQLINGPIPQQLLSSGWATEYGWKTMDPESKMYVLRNAGIKWDDPTPTVSPGPGAAPPAPASAPTSGQHAIFAPSGTTIQQMLSEGYVFDPTDGKWTFGPRGSGTNNGGMGPTLHQPVGPGAAGAVEGAVPTDQEIYDRVLADIRANPGQFTGANFRNYQSPFADRYGVGINGLPKGALAKIDAFLDSPAFSRLATGQAEGDYTPPVSSAPPGPAPGTNLGGAAGTYGGNAQTSTPVAVTPAAEIPAVQPTKAPAPIGPMESPAIGQPDRAPVTTAPPVLGGPSTGPENVAGATGGAGIAPGTAGGAAPIQPQLPPVAAPTGAPPALGSAPKPAAAAYEDPAFTAARKASIERLNAPSVWSPEKLQSQIDYYTGTYKKNMQQTGKQIEAQAIGQGLWWSGDRGKAMGLNLENYGKAVSEGVVAPLTAEAMKQNELSKQQAIDSAAQIGSQGYSQWLSSQQLGLSADQQALKSRLDMAATTGQFNLPTIKASELGVDVSTWRNPDGSANMEKWTQTVKDLRERGKTVLGRELTVAEIQALGSGQELKDLYVPSLGQRSLDIQEAGVTGTYKGADTFQAKQAFGFDRQVTNADGTKTTQHVYGAQEIQQALQATDQSFQKIMAAGFNYTDPTTGQVRRVLGNDERLTTEFQRTELVRTGYDKVATDKDGKPLVDKDGKPIMKHVEGAQELSSRLADRELALKEKGLSQDDAHFVAQQEWLKMQYTGFYQVEKNPNGEVVTDTNGQPVMKWVNGSSGIEEARNQLQRDLQAAGISADVAKTTADHDYQDKVRNGYEAVDKDGKTTWIRGTQSDTEYLLTLQQNHQTSEANAQRIFNEEQRAGYDKVVEIKNDKGVVTGTKVIHVGGTETFADTQARKAELAQTARDTAAQSLTRYGMTLDNANKALDRAQALKMQKNQFGQELSMTIRAELMTQEGWTRQEAEAVLDRQAKVDADALVNTLTRDGWKAEDARQAVEIASKENEAQLDRSQQSAIDDRHNKLASSMQQAGFDHAQQLRANEALDALNLMVQTKAQDITIQTNHEAAVKALQDAGFKNEEARQLADLYDKQLARTHDAQQQNRVRELQDRLANRGFDEARLNIAAEIKGRLDLQVIEGNQAITVADRRQQFEKELQQQGFTHDEALAVSREAFDLERQNAQLTEDRYRTTTEASLTRAGWNKEDARAAADRLSREKMHTEDLHTRSQDASDARRDEIAHEDMLEWGGYRTVVDKTGKYKVEWVEGRQDHQTSLTNLQNNFNLSSDQVRYLRTMATQDVSYLRDQYMQSEVSRLMGADSSLSSADAQKQAGDNWAKVAGAFGDPPMTLQERLEVLSANRMDARQAAGEDRADARQATADEQAQDRADKQYIIGAISTLSAPLFRRAIEALWPADGPSKIKTAADVVSLGITDPTKASKIAEIAVGRTVSATGEGLVNNGLGAAASAAIPGGYTNAQGVSMIPAALTGGTEDVPVVMGVAPAAATVVVAAALLYGAYTTYKGAARTFSSNNEYDNWLGSIPPAQYASMKNTVEDMGEHDHRGSVIKISQEMLDERQHGMSIADAWAKYHESPRTGVNVKLYQHAASVAVKIENDTALDLVRANVSLRNLIDHSIIDITNPAKGVDLNNMTNSDAKLFADAWSRIPADYRTTQLPTNMTQRPPENWNPSDEQMQSMGKDLVNFAAAAGTRPTGQLLVDIAKATSPDTALGAKIAKLKSASDPAKIANNLTRGEQETVRQLWVQRGGDPRVDVVYMARSLSTDAKDVNYASKNWMDLNYWPSIDEPTKKIVGYKKPETGSIDIQVVVP